MARRRQFAVIAAVCLLAGAPGALAQTVQSGPITAPPAKASFRIGALELTALRDGGFVTPNDGGDFGSKAGPAAVAKQLSDAGLPTDRITLSINVLLVRMPGHLVLLDTGVGPPDHGALPQSLAMAGVSPSAITDVLITHGHFDHVGGLLDAAGKPAFPRATIHMSARTWAWMQGEPDTRNLSVVIAPQVSTFEPGGDVLPGVRSIALDGHTPGHTGYELTSEDQKIEDIGDMAHSSVISLAEPDWTGGMDMDPPVAAATRRRELDRVAAGDELIFAPHFPFPGVGRLEPKGNGYAWKPLAGAGPSPP
jgi:glyoxylase-like metal-dependent hydrolase (beta-lactamase superfamily II)